MFPEPPGWVYRPQAGVTKGRDFLTTIELTGGPGAVSAARHAIEQLADREQLPRVDDLRLLVSELVTNSVLHGGAGPDDRVSVSVEQPDSCVRVEVCDHGRGWTQAEAIEVDRQQRAPRRLGTVARRRDRRPLGHQLERRHLRVVRGGDAGERGPAACLTAAGPTHQLAAAADRPGRGAAALQQQLRHPVLLRLRRTRRIAVAPEGAPGGTRELVLAAVLPVRRDRRRIAA